MTANLRYKMNVEQRQTYNMNEYRRRQICNME